MPDTPQDAQTNATRDAFQKFEQAPDSIMQLPALELAICHCMRRATSPDHHPLVVIGSITAALANMVRHAYEAGLDGQAAPAHADLLPCPFCGMAPDIYQASDGSVEIACHHGECGPMPRVKGRSADLAAAAWNDRTGGGRC